MTDLRSHLEEIAATATAPTAAQVDADLARGRSALRRRRAGQTIAGSAFGVAALVAAFSVATAGTSAGPHSQAGDRPASAAAVQLVAYKGEQPKGFTVDKVPDGWFIQADNKYGLLIAPESARNPGPDVNPSKDPVYDPQSFVDKIGIMLESRDVHGPSRPGTTVQVGDRKGTLLKSLPGQTPDGPVPPAPGGDTGWELWVEQPSGVFMIVQFWQGIGLSQDQMIELGAGVHVHKEAEQTRG